MLEYVNEYDLMVLSSKYPELLVPIIYYDDLESNLFDILDSFYPGRGYDKYSVLIEEKLGDVDYEFPDRLISKLDDLGFFELAESFETKYNISLRSYFRTQFDMNSQDIKIFLDLNDNNDEGSLRDVIEFTLELDNLLKKAGY